MVENGVRWPTPLIDLSEEVGDWRDYGLLGFALDPNFYVNGYIYLLYVVDYHHLLRHPGLRSGQRLVLPRHHRPADALHGQPARLTSVTCWGGLDAFAGTATCPNPVQPVTAANWQLPIGNRQF